MVVQSLGVLHLLYDLIILEYIGNTELVARAIHQQFPLLKAAFERTEPFAALAFLRCQSLQNPLI